MITDLISSFKGDIVSNVTSKFGIGSDKADGAVDIAKDNITGTLKSEAAKGNFSELKSALSGSDTTQTNGIVKKVMDNYMGDLTSKLGLSPSQSSAIASFVIPFIFNKIGGSTKSKGQMDESGIMSMLGGGDAIKNIKDGIAGKIGGLFGGK